jgi:hypothetical protein
VKVEVYVKVSVIVKLKLKVKVTVKVIVKVGSGHVIWLGSVLGLEPTLTLCMLLFVGCGSRACDRTGARLRQSKSGWRQRKERGGGTVIE